MDRSGSNVELMILSAGRWLQLQLTGTKKKALAAFNCCVYTLDVNRTDGTRDDVTILSSLNQEVQGGKPVARSASQGTA